MIGRMVTVGGEIAGITCRGGRLANEDAYTILNLSKGYLIAVADGIGGQRAGERASSLAISTLRDHISERYIGGLNTEECHKILKEGFCLADQAVRTAAVGDAEGMGTTLVAALIGNGNAIIAHTGDSRAYHLSDTIISVTRDHSLVADLVDRGVLDPSEVNEHPMRSYITQSIGGDFLVTSMVTTLHPGEILLLATDGFYEYLDDQTIIRESLSHDPKEMLHRLMQRALKMTKDNATAVIYRHPI